MEEEVSNNGGPWRARMNSRAPRQKEKKKKKKFVTIFPIFDKQKFVFLQTQKARRHLPLSLAKSTPESVGVSDNKENQFATEDCDGATDGLELKYLQRSEGALVRGAAASQGLAPPLSPIRPPSAAPIGCNGEEDTSGTTSCNSNSVASAYFPTKSTGKSETEHNGSAEDVPSPAIVAAAATT